MLILTSDRQRKNDQDDMRNPTRRGFQNVPNTEDKENKWQQQ